ncbi:MAG: FlgD immunoglobulin-like domain containing protein [Gemmatimonadota bacterium]
MKLALGIAAVAMAFAATAVQAEPAIMLRALSGEEIAEYGLPEGTQKASGLTTVGVGQPVYLVAVVDDGLGASATVSWALTTKPSGSTAALAPSVLGPNVPAFYEGTWEEPYDAIGRQMLVPDKTGSYVVTANTVTDSGAVSVTLNITAATYVGVGTVGGATPAFPQCGMCHQEKVDEWAGTGHATMLERGLDGILSSHYGAACVSCHTVGYDEAAGAVNGGFDDVAAQAGWTFPTELKPGTFAALPADLKAKANIQCEGCHGPGSEHKGDPAKISVSNTSGTCAVCHDEGTHHFFPREWQESRHANNVDESGRYCVACHAGEGYVQRMEIAPDIWGADSDFADKLTELDHSPIACQTCHDSHDATNPHQLRAPQQLTLVNGVVVTEGGNGKQCMSCHTARRGGDEYAATYHSRHDPHHSNQTDMLVGTNAAEYGLPIRRSAHIFATEDACATCHMQAVAATLPDGSPNPAKFHAGEHTFSMTYDGGTPDNEADDVEMVGVCASCHGPVPSFNLPREDFDGDGRVEGVQTEVQGLMDMLAMALPPEGEPTVANPKDTYTVAQLKAVFNYNFVLDDGSVGIHNTRYAVGILKASLKDLTGRDIVTAVSTEATGARPGQFALEQNNPNPFNPSTAIRYQVPTPSEVQLDIYNALGQQVRSLVSASHAAGEYTVEWDGRDNQGQQVTSGVYFYSMKAGDFSQNRKMVMLE